MQPVQLRLSETDRIEWKRSAQDSEGILRAACALANDLGASGRPGYLVIGLEKDGKVRPLEPDRLDQVQQDLANRLRSVKIQPTPSCDIAVHRFDREGFVVVVAVAPYPVPPVVTVDGVAWVRQGSSTRRASAADLQRLNERRPEHTQPFDIRPFASASVEDLDLDLLRAKHAAERIGDSDTETFPALEAWLTQHQLGRVVSGVWRPNPAALLLYGVSPQSWLPGATIELVRYAGSDIDSDVVARKTITGTLADQLEGIWAQINANLASVPDQAGNTGMVERFVPEYPLEALKELARNLVQHRLYESTHAPGRVEWYADRIEFSNPGGPFGRASEGELGEHSDYRNPIVTAGLVDMGYVQQLGRGVRRVRLLLERNGNPPLKVEKDGFTRVVVRRRP
ncbi:putative transcriptional regulator [Thiocapsa sp. KS1]|nr:RNA-binding domain-containing protein [Thiocapsa sp. KS1]CRI65094.1 putative transcriptional regulator [Thiocapsa sp. KS1]